MKFLERGIQIMNANKTKSSISVMLAVLLGVVTLAAVPESSAQDRTRSDRQTRTAKRARGVRSLETSAAQMARAPKLLSLSRPAKCSQRTSILHVTAGPMFRRCESTAHVIFVSSKNASKLP